MKRKNWTQLAILASALSFVVSADTIWTGATDSDFGTASNWDAGLPGTGDATIGNGDTVNLSSDYGTLIDRLVVNGNSTLNVSAAVTANKFSLAAGSFLNLNGGAVTLPKTSSGNNSQYWIAGTLEITGGTHGFQERMAGEGTIRVIGDDATINFHQIASAMTYEFDFDSTGVSPIIGAGSSGAGPYFALVNATLSVDGSAFAGAPGTFTLFDSSANGSLFNPANVSIQGLGDEGVGWTLQQYTDSGRNFVELTVIPEPSALGILGVGMALCLILRRRP